MHDLTGLAFEKRYEEYEALAAEGKMDQHKTIPAKDLWRKMLTMLFETGHPWITFKRLMQFALSATTHWSHSFIQFMYRDNPEH